MIKIHPPSFVGTYDVVSTFDEAIAPPEDVDRRADESDADHKARTAPIWEQWRARLSVARETAQWAGVLKPDVTPTIFKMRQIPGRQWQQWERVAAGLSDAEQSALLVRMALTGATNWLDGFKVGPLVEHVDAHGNPSGLGKVAPLDVIDAFYQAVPGAVAVRIIEELATVIVQHRVSHSGN